MERLKAIRVQKLFGSLDHSIDLDNNSGITILHGANGSGKSTILRAIEEISHGLPLVLMTIPFDSFSFEFESGTTLSLKRGRTKYIELSLLHKDQKTAERWKIGSSERIDEWRQRYRHFRSDILHMERLSHWDLDDIVAISMIALENNDFDFLSALSRKHGRLEEQYQLFDTKASIPAWLAEFWKTFECSLIEEQRLLAPDADSNRHPRFKRVVSRFADLLKSSISAVLNGYANRAQRLDRTFPHRVISEVKTEPSPGPQLGNDLLALERRVAELQEAGLLDNAPSMSDISAQSLRTKAVRRILSVFAKDTADKLSVFDDIYSRITLFESLINSHLAHKTVHVSRQEGLSFRMNDGQPLRPEALSSGEQHILVLFFKLIFERHHLVLIDEPELSLHPAWQVRFISDLEKIRELGRIDFILATHSPEIIGDNWDMTRALKV